ncbi:hypothetical protein NLG42_10640 [Flavobacterium plurextorum]|uniref:MauE/DoxX family redox-associated membrane protein n=1 Tax=Flavobacterium TaxID=237 RepID=UPI00214DD6DC|nr:MULTISPECIES: MauE/DoxX family redox-associated membrane protein [Flavobacterium]UUW11245.1 hypothetical protein NLG42_10640 [Flavobacterium plurextorum]
MNLKGYIKQPIIEVISLLYILLFIYAAVSKLLDFENFQVQVGQSPLVSAFASWIVWTVPVLELIIALLLCIPRFRIWGLLGAFSLMAMFTVYIFIVLNYSSFVPCSCGGILEKMSWKVHLVFNVVFALLAAAAIYFYAKAYNLRLGRHNFEPVKSMLVIFLCSTGLMIFLFLRSENIMHYKNPFTRRYAKHPSVFLSQKDLKFNSFYIAGMSNGRIYLGNYTSPGRIVSVDEKLKNEQVHQIIFDPAKIAFKSIRISVSGGYFYIKDGTVPVIFRGKISDWKIDKEFKGMPYFTVAEPMDSTTIVFRSNNGKKLANIIGIYSAGNNGKSIYNDSLLQQQIDGVFDTDGVLTYSEIDRKILYLYYYRNEFIVAGKTGNLALRGRTIDTTTKAKIKISYLKNDTQRKMSAPPYVVNAKAAVCENLLFVHSKIKGRYENDKLWDQASIIDVYDFNRNEYLLSFPVYNSNDGKMSSFKVTRKYLYAVVGKKLALYEFKDKLSNEMKSNNPK